MVKRTKQKENAKAKPKNNELELHQYRVVMSYCEMTFIASDDQDAREHAQQWLTNHTNGFAIERVYMSNKEPWL